MSENRLSRRRLVCALLAFGLGSGPLDAGAQAPDSVRRIGFVTLRSGPNEVDAAFRDALQGLGYVEGRTIRIDYRWAAGSEKRAEELAAELVARRVEVIVAATTPAIAAAMRATKSIPIVMAAAADPVGTGVVASLARPGGNVTGLTMVSTDTGAKRLQLLRDLSPTATRIGVLLMGAGGLGPEAPVNSLLIEQLQAAARQLGVSLTVIGISGGAELAGAFATMLRERAQALIVQASPVTIDNRGRIVELAERHRLPALYEVDGFVDAGGLLSYGPSLPDMYRRAAGFVDRILKGARPADLPVEEPTRFDLVLNLKAAKRIGLTIPAGVLVRADRIIE